MQVRMEVTTGRRGRDGGRKGEKVSVCDYSLKQNETLSTSSLPPSLPPTPTNNGRDQINVQRRTLNHAPIHPETRPSPQALSIQP